jgi:hypothetical protein
MITPAGSADIYVYTLQAVTGKTIKGKLSPLNSNEANSRMLNKPGLLIRRIAASLPNRLE